MSSEIIQLQVVILEEKIKLLKMLQEMDPSSLSYVQVNVRINTLQFVLDKMVQMGMEY
jgi:hypothetical protein